MANLFTTNQIVNSNERPVVRNVTGDFLENNLAGSSEGTWKSDPVGVGLQNTQQLLVDWSDFSKHVFFNSAEAKVNLAFDQIVNGYPFDGTSEEKRQFMASIGGYTKHIYDQLDSHVGYLNFTQNTNADYNYAQVEDHTGLLAPDLATIVGDAKASRYMATNGSTHEFWMYVPDDNGDPEEMAVNEYAVIYQKSDAANGTETKKGITIWHTYQTLNQDTNIREYDVHFMIGSDDFKSITHSIQGLEVDRWYHVAFVYERATTEKVLSYVDGRYVSDTVVNQAELDDITLASGTIRIGWSTIRQIGHASNFMSIAAANVPLPYKGLIDELRIWLGPRTPDLLLKNYKRNVNNDENLLVYYRFNEPPITSYSYGAKSILLDYSGNSLHNQITYSPGSIKTNLEVRQPFVVNSENLAPPVSLEKLSENKILFPDWGPNRTLNQELLLEGNHYDRNNPNLITNLVPRHYFEEATYFEGIEEDWEEPKQFGTQTGPVNPIPGHGTVPTRLVMMSFLLMWANFFDDIKLYIDHFSLLDKVNYDSYEQIPPQLITFLSDYYGLQLPDPYTNETPDRYQDGENIENASGVATPLKKTIDAMWRRVLINLPFLLRSRGTVAGIKALFNTLGIESDGIFKLREYGGNLSNKITSSRRKRKKRVKLLDFSQITYAQSSSLWAYRHEPGAPDPAAAPVMASINQQFGDIVYDTPAGPPVTTLYTSGSWSYEGRYTLDDSEDTSSLLRIEKDGEILVNLVAQRIENADGTAYEKAGVQLHFDGHKTGASDPQLIEIENVNLWDSSAWYVQVYHELADNPMIGVRLLKANDKYIIEEHHAYKAITKDLITYDPTLGIDNKSDSGPPLYWYGNADHPLGPRGGDPNTLRFVIGNNAAAVYNGTLNSALANNTKNFSGLCSHIRFWTKALALDTTKEHVRNPFSISIESPISSFAFMTSPVQQGGQKVPLEKYISTYPNALPTGSWERLRQSFDMLQGEVTLDNTGTLEVIDTSQNMNNLTINGTAGNNKVFKEHEITYNISSADFDFNSASNKIRVRSFQDKTKAKENFVHHGKIVRIPSQVGIDDRRFSIESSLVHALSEDMLNLTGDSDIFNNYLGAPELEYAVEYPEITKLRDLYFERIVGRVNYNTVIEFQRWFNGNFASLVEQFIPHTADFLGINFVIESHLLERHKLEYKQGDVHVDVSDRVAFEQVPLFLGVIKSENT